MNETERAGHDSTSTTEKSTTTSTTTTTTTTSTTTTTTTTITTTTTTEEFITVRTPENYFDEGVQISREEWWDQGKSHSYIG